MTSKTSKLENFIYGVGSKAKKVLTNVEFFKSHPLSLRKGPIIKYGLLAGGVLGPSVAPGISTTIQAATGNSPQAKEISVEPTNYTNPTVDFMSSEADFDEKTRHELWKEERDKMMQPKYSFKDQSISDQDASEQGLNLFLAVNKWNRWGLGNILGNESVTQEDYNALVAQGVRTNIFGTDQNIEDKVYRGDMDFDEDSGDADDLRILQEIIDGTHPDFNRFELMSPERRDTYKSAIVRSNRTKEISPTTSKWECYDYSFQEYIETNGIPGIENTSIGDERENGKRAYDIRLNGVRYLPGGTVHTKFEGSLNGLTTSTTHSINVFYRLNAENQEVKSWSSRWHLEPQTGEVVEKGNRSLNDYANEERYGYIQDIIFGDWSYGDMPVFDYNLEGASITVNDNEYIKTSWNPFTFTIPSVETQEYYAGIGGKLDELTDGVENIYPGTTIEKFITDGQAQGDVFEKYNFGVSVVYKAKAGAYDENTHPSEAVKTLNFEVKDTTPPYWDGASNSYKDNSEGELEIINRTESTQGSDNWKDNYYVYINTTYQKAKDKSKNESLERIAGTEEVGTLPTGTITAPADYVTTVSQGATIPEAPADGPGKATVNVTQDAPYKVVVWDKRTSKTDEKEEYERTHSLFYATATDSIKVKQKLTYNIDLGQDPLNLQKTYNPTNNTLELKTLGNGNFNLDLDIYYVFGGKKASLDPVARDYTGKGATHTYDLTALEGKLVDIRILATKTMEKDREILKVK